MLLKLLTVTAYDRVWVFGSIVTTAMVVPSGYNEA